MKSKLRLSNHKGDYIHRRPRNFQALEDANRTADGYNPLCGDQITLFLEVEDGKIKDIGFQGTGCAISKASASMMTEVIKDQHN